MKKTIYKIFNHYWSPYIAIGIAGVLSAFYFGITGTVWAVTGEFTRFGGHLLELVGIDISDWAYFNMISMEGTPTSRTDGWIIWGMFIGALIMVLLNNNFKLRIPNQRRRLVQGLIGGLLAGFGARLALGCNLAAFFTGVPQFSFHAWVFMVATAIGTYIGIKIINTRWWKGRPILTRGGTEQSAKDVKVIQPYIGVLLAVGYTGLIIYFFIIGKPLLGFAALFGAAFGILIERGQICFTSAFRDLWVSGRALMAKAIAAGMAISTLFTFFIIMYYGLEPVTKITAPSTLIGGILFGLGIVLAGGCETGMMYRLMEGQVVFIPVFVGNIVGATFLAYAWDHLYVYDLLVKSGSHINLLHIMHPAVALFVSVALLVAWYVVSAYWQKNYRFGVGFKRG